MIPDAGLVARIVLDPEERDAVGEFSMGNAGVDYYTKEMHLKLVCTRKSKKEAVALIYRSKITEEMTEEWVDGVLWRTKAGNFFGSVRVGDYVGLCSATARMIDGDVVLFISCVETEEELDGIPPHEYGIPKLRPRPFKYLIQSEPAYVSER